MEVLSKPRVASSGLVPLYTERQTETSFADEGQATVQRAARPAGAFSLSGWRQLSPLMFVGQPNGGNAINYELRLGFDIPGPTAPSGPGDGTNIAGCIDYRVGAGVAQVLTPVIAGMATAENPVFEPGDYLSKDITFTAATNFPVWLATVLGNTDLVPDVFEKAGGSGSGDQDAVEAVGWGDLGNASYLYVPVWASDVEEMQVLAAFGS